MTTKNSGGFIRFAPHCSEEDHSVHWGIKPLPKKHHLSCQVPPLNLLTFLSPFLGNLPLNIGFS